jgi:hypothetical protein
MASSDLKLGKPFRMQTCKGYPRSSWARRARPWHCFSDLLKREGFYPQAGFIDGVLGPSTVDAVKNLQAAMVVAIDGTVGDQTWEVLG